MIFKRLGKSPKKEFYCLGKSRSLTKVSRMSASDSGSDSYSNSYSSDEGSSLLDRVMGKVNNKKRRSDGEEGL